jgi:diadenosine tetraphosphate (Ap4A) HIT family hydrolase
LHELGLSFRARFLVEMSLVAEVVHKTFRPRKMNYELLGNVVPHLHWHLLPRYAEDPNPKGPIWEVERSVWQSDQYIPGPKELESMKRSLLDGLKSAAGIDILSTF